MYATQPAPFIHAPQNVSDLMRQVLYALIPGTLVYIYFFGWGVFWHILIAVVTALATEALMLWLRKRPIRPYLSDYSAVLTGWLLALAIPPLAPWWITVVGVLFALIFAKHLYGGLGFNPFNPAMVGFATLLISFPAEMTHWPTLPSISGHYLSFVDSLSIILTEAAPAGVHMDAISGATPLDYMKNQLSQSMMVGEIKQNPLFGDFGARGWEWIGNAFLLGGLWLLWKRVISWHIPVSVLGSLFFISLVFYFIDPDTHPSPLFHIFSGASILCAFFIATDPVSAATSRIGKIYYGIGIGVLIYVIRTWGSYPDAIAFAVLLMNLSAPMLDKLTLPPAFGANQDNNQQGRH